MHNLTHISKSGRFASRGSSRPISSKIERRIKTVGKQRQFPTKKKNLSQSSRLGGAPENGNVNSWYPPGNGFPPSSIKRGKPNTAATSGFASRNDTCFSNLPGKKKSSEFNRAIYFPDARRRAELPAMTPPRFSE